MLDKGDSGMPEAAWDLAKESFHYLADLRLENEKRESVMFLTTNLLAQVAERHSNISDQGQMNFWMDKLELNDPAKFLPKPEVA